MIPQAYQIPAALVLVLAGALACFAGYRLFRYVLAIFGFIFGAAIASSTMGATDTTGMLVAALVGGLVGAVVLMLAYFVGIALVGAGVGALLAHFGWDLVGRGDPHMLLVIGLAVVGAVAAMFVQRHVIIVTTAFGGALTLMWGILAAAGDRGVIAATTPGRAWVLYPTVPLPGDGWLPYAWLVLGLSGTIVQLTLTGRKR